MEKYSYFSCACKKFAGKSAVILCAKGLCPILKNTLAVAGGFGQSNIVADTGGEQHFPPAFPQPLGHISIQGLSPIVKSQEDSQKRQGWIESLPHALHRLLDQLQPRQRIEQFNFEMLKKYVIVQP